MIVKGSKNNLTLSLDNLEFDEAIKYPQKEKIKKIHFMIHYLCQGKYLTYDFSLLKLFPNIEYLNFGIFLSQESIIDSIYGLKNLKHLNYHGNNDRLPLKYNKLEKLEIIEMFYSKNNKQNNFEKLNRLKILNIWNVENVKDLKFLGKLNNLKELNIFGSNSIKNLNGIEYLTSLETLILSGLISLEDMSSLFKLKPLNCLHISYCNKINVKNIDLFNDYYKRIYTKKVIDSRYEKYYKGKYNV